MSKVTASAIAIMLAAILSKILGFGRELALASAYGTSSYSDAYLVALNIPIIIFAGIGSALATSYIPLYHNVTEKYDEERASKFTNNIINIITIISFIILILGFVFTKEIVKLFAIGFTGDTLQLTVNFTRILFLGIIFMGINYIITSYLQLKGNFIIPALIGLPNNIIIITSIFLSARFNNIYILVWGTLIGTLSQFLFQLPSAYKKGYKYSLNLDIKDEFINKMLFLVIPVFVGSYVNQINTLVDRSLASTLSVGSISALNYSNRLVGFVIGIFVMAISTAVYPMISKMASIGDKENFNKSIVKAINAVVLVVLPISVGAMVLSDPITKILFERGAFDSKATDATAVALFYYSIGIIGYALNDILGKIFYSLQDTKTPMLTSFFSVVINISLNLILIRYMAHAGLALATSISGILGVLLLFRSLKRKIGYYGQDKVYMVIAKTAIASLIMGFMAKISYNYLVGILGTQTTFHIISLGLSILIGGVVYGVLILLLKIEEVGVLIDLVKSKLKISK